jgi:hypothetical protein
MRCQSQDQAVFYRESPRTPQANMHALSWLAAVNANKPGRSPAAGVCLCAAQHTMPVCLAAAAAATASVKQTTHTHITSSRRQFMCVLLSRACRSSALTALQKCSSGSTETNLTTRSRHLSGAGPISALQHTRTQVLHSKSAAAQKKPTLSDLQPTALTGQTGQNAGQTAVKPPSLVTKCKFDPHAYAWRRWLVSLQCPTGHLCTLVCL